MLGGNMLRRYSLTDKLISQVDYLLEKTLTKHFQENSTNQQSSQQSSTKGTPQASQSTMLTKEESQQSIAMLRVDHSGEVCAQALYYGQAFVARSEQLKTHLFQAANEEQAHLLWCRQRLRELGGRTSWLNPFWATGAFSIGLASGLAGDGWNLGFLAETENQVTEHLDSQLKELSPNDHQTRAILEQMKEDEQKHASDALHRGAKELPWAIKGMMKVSAKVMTTVAYHV